MGNCVGKRRKNKQANEERTSGAEVEKERKQHTSKRKRFRQRMHGFSRQRKHSRSVSRAQPQYPENDRCRASSEKQQQPDATPSGVLTSLKRRCLIVQMQMLERSRLPRAAFFPLFRFCSACNLCFTANRSNLRISIFWVESSLHPDFFCSEENV